MIDPTTYTLPPWLLEDIYLAADYRLPGSFIDAFPAQTLTVLFPSALASEGNASPSAQLIRSNIMSNSTVLQMLLRTDSQSEVGRMVKNDVLCKKGRVILFIGRCSAPHEKMGRHGVRVRLHVARHLFLQISLNLMPWLIVRVVKALTLDYAKPTTFSLLIVSVSPHTTTGRALSLMK